nr:MAG TPA: hypothetical protein [Caudoviricetes sp.]
MVIKNISEVEELKEIVKKNKETGILLINTFENDFDLIKEVIEVCNSISIFLSIEIGRNYFYIKPVYASSGKCYYYISTRTIEDIVRSDVL